MAKHTALDLRHTSLLDKMIWFLGVGLGSGLFPKAPGTMGSLAVLILYPIWLWLGFPVSLVLIILMTVCGIYICGHSAKIMRVHDDGRIVWDEFAGQSIALLPLIYVANSSFWWLLIAFLLFRLFDIWKPFPIGWIDRHVDGGLGIMLDDILAGIMAAIVCLLIYFFIF